MFVTYDNFHLQNLYASIVSCLKYALAFNFGSKYHEWYLKEGPFMFNMSLGIFLQELKKSNSFLYK